MGWPSVQGYQDGVDRVDAETLNRPLGQLAERTEYLKRLIANSNGQRVALVGVELSGDVKPTRGQPVYRVPDNGTYARAAGTAFENAWFYASDEAMAVGIVESVDQGGGTGTVVLYGYAKFGEAGSADNPGIPVADVIADENPASGRYFLSARAGLLTSKPNGPVIYVCDCQIANVKVGDAYELRVMSMLVSPQYRDTGESHIHRSFVLSGSPMGGYSVKAAGRYRAVGIADGSVRDADKNPSALPSGVVLVPCGWWDCDRSVTYTITVSADGSAFTWSSGDGDGSGEVEADDADSCMTKPVAVGSHGLLVRFVSDTAGDFSAMAGKQWSVTMPDAARAWVDYKDDGGSLVGFRLNLGMYPEMARYVPPLPKNGAALTMDAFDVRGPVFGADKQWDILDAGDDGGPWLVWYGGAADGSSSLTTPFKWADTVAGQAARYIALHLNRMRVGPTGFVTSLQAAPGSALRITSAQTGAPAVQGALQVDMDIDFASAERDAPGHMVVKRIEGSRFILGPVVERIVAGPGMAVSREQGIVTVSASNAVYAGDFETIALKNAKQDLVGGVFPYVKLLGWQTGRTNIDSGFTAKFRVPDHIPYKEYYVVVSASVFGEVADSGVASFTLKGYTLADMACAADASEVAGSIANLSPVETATIGVDFPSGYSPFDPILIHGFPSEAGGSPGTIVLPDDADGQRQAKEQLWLGTTAGAVRTGVRVKPGYFVGLDIARCGTDGSEYIHPIGFLSLRWNLVEA